MLIIVIAAVALAALAIGTYVYFNPTPPGPTGEVQKIWVYPIHRESTVGGGQGGGVGVKQPFDQVIVLALVKIQNPGKIPVFIREISAEVSLAHGETEHSLGAGSFDFNRIFAAYPEMATTRQAPLLRETTIPPGGSAEGMAAFNYSMTKEQWDTHTSLEVSISFVHQQDLVLKAPQEERHP